MQLYVKQEFINNLSKLNQQKLMFIMYIFLKKEHYSILKNKNLHTCWRISLHVLLLDYQKQSMRIINEIKLHDSRALWLMVKEKRQPENHGIIGMLLKYAVLYSAK